MSDELSQVPFTSGAEFTDNPEQRCPCLLLLDTSGSMSGAPIAELNAGLATLQSELSADTLAARRVDLAIVTFGPVEIRSDFTAAQSFYPPHLEAATLLRLHPAREQALGDMKSLNLTPPPVYVAPVRPVPAAPTYTRAAPTAGAAPLCPLCGSSMRRRTASRGRNRGGQFWGCSRYPNCSATRSYP